MTVVALMKCVKLRTHATTTFVIRYMGAGMVRGVEGGGGAIVGGEGYNNIYK